MILFLREKKEEGIILPFVMSARLALLPILCFMFLKVKFCFVLFSFLFNLKTCLVKKYLLYKIENKIPQY